MSEFIEIKNISKSFGSYTVFAELSLSFRRGGVTCITGASGCGKTTLLRLIAGLDQPDSGVIEKGGASLGYVFQEDRLTEDFSAVSNIRLVTGKGMSDDDIRRHLTEIGLRNFTDKKVRGFSGGMKRRVAIARAVCYNADILLMDEPFKGLDPALKTGVMDYVKKYTAGKTVIYVTHDPAEAEYMGGEIVQLPGPFLESGV